MRATLLVCLSVLGAACNCGHDTLIAHVGSSTPGSTPVLDAGASLSCGDGVVTAPEQCEPVLEGNDGSCGADCRWVAFDAGVVVPPLPDAGTQPDAGTPPDAGMGQGTATVQGVLSEVPGAMAPTLLHPKRPIEGALVHVRLKGSATDVVTAHTHTDGSFRLELKANVAYELLYEVPAQFEQPDSLRAVSPLAPGETGQFDYDFLVKGVHFVVRDRTTGEALTSVQVSIVDSANGTALVAPVLTDVDGYVLLPSTTVPGKTLFVKSGYLTETLDGTSANTMHTIVGGMSLVKK